MIFYIKKINPDGKIVSIIDSFENITDAIDFIESEGSTPIEIKKLPLNFLEPFFKINIKTEYIIEILQNIHLIIKSGIPLQTGITDLIKESKDNNTKKVLKHILINIQKGNPLSYAFEKYKKIFGNIVIFLLKIGEETGNLDQTLKQAQNFISKIESIRKKIKQAMIYPIFAIIAIFSAMLVWILYVMPKIIKLFKDMNVELPITTRIVMNISDFLQNYIFYIFIGFIFLIIIFISSLKNEKFKLKFDKFLLKLPIISTFIKLFYSAIFSEYLKLTISSGISIIDGLNILRKNISNLVYKNSIEEIIFYLKKGYRISEAIKQTNVYPLFVTRMISIGEDTGELEKQLQTISDNYYEKIDYMANNISKFIEPIMIFILGIFMAIIILSLFGPIYSLIGKIS